MHPRTKFARLVAAVAVVTVAIAAAAPAAGGTLPSAVGHARVALVLDPCPLTTTIEVRARRLTGPDGGYLLDAALIAPPRPESGFECPINRTPV
jgi:hypothetical protein